MAYPTEIIEEMTKKYSLSKDLQKQLYNCLIVSGVQAMLDSNFLKSEDLIQQAVVKGTNLVSILPDKSAKNIVVVFKQNRTDQQILSQLKSWIDIVNKITLLNIIPRSHIRAKKNLANAITTLVLPLVFFIVKIPALQEEYTEISSLLPQYMNLSVESLETAATKYFTEFFEGTNRKIIGKPHFFTKIDGDQLGRRMQIRYINEETKEQQEQKEQIITYFIKTHQHGTTSQTSSTKPVDPKELFVYKVLEYTSIGPKTHFFLNPLFQGGFFIATQDVAFTKIPGKQKTFKTYFALKQGYDTEFKEKKQSTNKVAEKGITRADMLARIFWLYDATTNPTNLGCVTVEQKQDKWKILDFRIPTNVQYAVPGIFEAFRQGNGMYNYQGYMGYILRDRGELERMATAMQVFTEFELGLPQQSRQGRKMPLLTAIDKAFYEVSRYVQQNARTLGISDLRGILGDLSQIDLNRTSEKDFTQQLSQLPIEQAGDFGRYAKEIKINFQNFAQGVKTKYAELCKRPL